MSELYKRKYIDGKEFKMARYIMEQHLGRKLERNEWVHHKDGNRFNDSIDNLEVLTPSEHTIEHIKRGDRFPWSGVHIPRKESTDPNEAWCTGCKKFLDKALFTKDSAHWNGFDPYCRKCRKVLWKKRGHKNEKELA